MLFHTAEIRWFFAGELPAGVETWFLDRPTDPGPSTTRTDYYLCLPERDSLGVKWREGRVELKQRYGQPRLVELAGQVSGRLERWRKWSFALAEAEAVLSSLTAAPGTWLAVEKTRRLRPYQINGPDAPVPLSPDDPPPAQGCEVEITQVTLQETGWWTLCLEAFGAEPLLPAYLQRVAAHIFKDEVPQPLPPEASFGYARLLQQLC